METLGVERAMKQCWDEVWPQVQASVSQAVTMASNLEVMQKLLGLMKQVCAAGFRTWLEQADCCQAMIQRDGRRLRFKRVSDKEFRFSATRVDWLLIATRCSGSFILRGVVRDSFEVTFRGDKDVERTGLDDGVESFRI